MIRDFERGKNPKSEEKNKTDIDDSGGVTKRSEQNDSLPQTTAVVKRLWVTKQVIAKVETFMKQW